MKSSLIKNQIEIAAIREACKISSQLHLLAMSSKVEGLSEIQLAKRLEQSFKLSRADRWAYPTIIGAGSRATILHAKPTQRKLKNSELVLVDMGVKYQNYASDITRTWPVGTCFSKEQKQIYKVVLKAQKEVIKQVRPGQNLPALHELAKEYLTDGVLKLGVTENIANLYPHKTSHWIGRFVHDQCPYYYQDNTPVRLMPGMCFTVEPGLYFKNKNSHYNNIGIRIEDVILVTESGCEVLSSVPKEIEEIEDLQAWAKTAELY